MSGSYFLYGSILEKCGNFWKNGRFSGRIWPDWGNTAQADMAGLGSIGLNGQYYTCALIQGFAYAHITIFDIPSLVHHRANYLAFNMYLGKQYRFY